MAKLQSNSTKLFDFMTDDSVFARQPLPDSKPVPRGNDITVEEILRFYPEVASVHPICNLLPPIDGVDRDRLYDSIKEDGLRRDIVLTHDRQLLDGKGRLIACFLGFVEPRFEVLSIDADPLAVWYSNHLRRQLTENDVEAFMNAWAASKANEVTE